MSNFMRNVFFCIASSFLTILGLFSNLTFAEVTPIVTATPLTTPTPSNVITGEATDVTSSSATLNGTVYLLISTKWFEYGTISGEYDSAVYDVRGTITNNASKEEISASISGLSATTTYYYRLVVYEKPPGGYTYGNEKSFTTLGATPIPTVTPMPHCEAEFVEVSPNRLTLRRGKSSEVTVILKGKKDCLTEGKIVTATINKVSNIRITVTPANQAVDENGEAKFVITARNKVGNARVTFKADNLKMFLTVKVR